MSTAYLSVDQALRLHEGLLKGFGGASGTRERGALEAALARPAATFGGEDLYVDLGAKAAALMHSIVLNHPFVDGNERAGVAAAEFFLMLNGGLVDASDEQLEALTLRLAAGQLAVEALAIWFRQRLRQID